MTQLPAGQKQGQMNAITVFGRFCQFVRVGAFHIQIDFNCIFQAAVVLKHLLLHCWKFGDQIFEAGPHRMAFHLNHLPAVGVLAMGLMNMDTDAHILLLFGPATALGAGRIPPGVKFREF
jgi:hypothetical protein